MVIVARGASRNVRMFPLTVLFTFTMVIIINCILGLITGFCCFLLQINLELRTVEHVKTMALYLTIEATRLCYDSVTMLIPSPSHEHQYSIITLM